MKINFKKGNGLVPAILQDYETKKVLMLAHMNQEAYDRTIETKMVTFYSQSKKSLWTKGEESGNFLNLIDIKVDCDNDALLVYVKPVGPTCHIGSDTCWGEKNSPSFGFLTQLENIIDDRKNNPSEKSYTSSLFKKGINKIAQKVGEEAVELVIEAKDDNRDLFVNEAADLMFHFLILLKEKNIQLEDVVDILKARHQIK